MTDTPARSRRPLLVAAAALGALILGALALYGTGAGSGNAVAAECRASQGVAKRLAPLARGDMAALGVVSTPKPAPEVTFLDPAGKPVTLAHFKGRTVLVNLWATWCAPCRHEMPALDRLQAELGGADFEVVAVNIDTRNLERPKSWLQETGVTRLAYYADPQAKILQTLQRSGHVVGLPTTILVDAAGCELGTLKGAADWAGPDALRLIRAALGREPAAE
jgi:thiol-disulfide isomerase/thioredoxin